MKRKAEDVDCVVRNCSPKVGRSTQFISNSVMDHLDGNFNANDCRIVRGQVINWVEVSTVDNLLCYRMLVPLFFIQISYCSTTLQIPRKLSEEINQMLAPLADKLNSKLVSYFSLWKPKLVTETVSF